MAHILTPFAIHYVLSFSPALAFQGATNTKLSFPPPSSTVMAKQEMGGDEKVLLTRLLKTRIEGKGRREGTTVFPSSRC